MSAVQAKPEATKSITMSIFANGSQDVTSQNAHDSRNSRRHRSSQLSLIESNLIFGSLSETSLPCIILSH